MSNVHDKLMNIFAQLLGKGAINKSIFQRKPKVVKEPIKEDVLEEPIKEVVLEEPIKEVVLEEPIKRNPGQYQIKVDAFIGKGEKLVILPDDFPPGNFNNKPVNKLNLIGRDVFTTRRDGQNLYIRCINPEQNGWRSKLIFCLEMTEEEYNNIVEKEYTYKSIELSNEVCSYITINNQTTSYGLDFVKNNQNPNIIDINLELYQYCNDLTIDTDIEIHKDIYNNGVPNGLIYSLKQIRNHIDDGEIEYREELSTGKKYITHNGENFEIKTLVNDIYSKPYETFIDDIKIIENHINVEHGVTPQIMCCFIGDAEVGATLLDKIITSDKNEYTSLFVFRSLDVYDILKSKLKNFTSRVIFKSKEYGNDIIPSLQALHWINTQYPNKIEYVYKIQTKSDKKWFDECTDYLLDYTNTKLIRMLGSDDTNSNCVGVPSKIRKIGQNGSCKTLIDKYKDDINKNRCFIAGTIFFCKMETIINVLRHIENNNYQSYFLNNCYDTNMVNITQSPPHFLERLFGGVNNIKIPVPTIVPFIDLKQTKLYMKYELLAHLHCYDIDNFEEIYGEYIETIIKYFNVIVTYHIGNKTPNLPLVFIQYNKEFNERFYVIKYLEDNNINYNNILFIQNIKCLDKFNLDEILIKIIESTDKIIALDITIESKTDNISDDVVNSFYINRKDLKLIDLKSNNLVNQLIYNQIHIFTIDHNLNVNYKYINYNINYSLLKQIKNDDYEYIDYSITEEFYDNVIIFCSHYKHYTHYVLNNIFNNLINHIANDSKLLVIIVYSSIEDIILIDKYKNNINSTDYVIVKDAQNDKVDFGKYCIGYKTLKYFNVRSEKYHLMNDSFICSKDCESMYILWRDKFKQFSFVGALHTQQLISHYQSWWLVMDDTCLDIYMNELLSYNSNFNSYYKKLKESFFKYFKNWEDYLHLNEIYLENKLIKIVDSGFLYDSGEQSSNLFYDDDNEYRKKMNEGFNIIKIKRIVNIPKRRYPVDFIHKKEYLDIFVNS